MKVTVKALLKTLDVLLAGVPLPAVFIGVLGDDVLETFRSVLLRSVSSKFFF